MLTYAGDNATGLVITDTKTPTMNGAEFTRQIRRLTGEPRARRPDQNRQPRPRLTTLTPVL